MIGNLSGFPWNKVMLLDVISQEILLSYLKTGREVILENEPNKGRKSPKRKRGIVCLFV